MSTQEMQNDVIAAFAAGTDIILAVVDVLPIAGQIATISKSVDTARKTFLNKKVSAFWEDFQAPNVNKVLLAQVYSNFRSDYGAEYFDDALFNAIEKSDSVKRTRMISRLIINCCYSEEMRTEFWSIIYVIQNLAIGDFALLEKAIKLQQKLNKLQEAEFIEQTKVINKQIGMLTLLRYQSCALARTANVYNGSRVPFINITFAKLVLKAISNS